MSWSSPGLQQIFDVTTNTSSKIGHPTSIHASTSRLNDGQIAGISIGAVLLVALTPGCFYLIARGRRLRAAKETVNTESQGECPLDHSLTVPEMRAKEPVECELTGTIVNYQRELRGDLGGFEVE